MSRTSQIDLDLNTLCEYEEGTLILSPEEAVEVERMKSELAKAMQPLAYRIQEFTKTIQPLVYRCVLAIQRIATVIREDELLSLCYKAMQDDPKAIKQLVNSYHLENRSLSYTERERLSNTLQTKDLYAIAHSAVYVWLRDHSPNLKKIAYLNDFSLPQLAAMPMEKRQKMLLRGASRMCRKTLLSEIGEHPDSKEPLRLEEDGSGTFAIDYEGNKKFPLINVLSENIEPIDLKGLSLDLDKLTPKELWIVKDVLQGFDEGYDFSSKLGRSFRERWDKDYEKNIKSWNRVKTKLKK